MFNYCFILFVFYCYCQYLYYLEIDKLDEAIENNEELTYFDVNDLINYKDDNFVLETVKDYKKSHTKSKSNVSNGSNRSSRSNTSLEKSNKLVHS